MRRDKNGIIIPTLRQRLRSWKLARKLRKGIIPRGRTDPSLAIQALRDSIKGNMMETFGILSARVHRKDGGTEDIGLLSVLKVVVAFRDYIVDSLQDSTTYPMDAFEYHACGTGVTAESNTQTALVTEIESRVAGTQIEGATADIYKTVATIPITGTHAVREHGVFSAAAAGTLMDRSLFSAINVNNGDSIEFTYEITFNEEV